MVVNRKMYCIYCEITYPSDICHHIIAQLQLQKYNINAIDSSAKVDLMRAKNGGNHPDTEKKKKLKLLLTRRGT